MIVWSPDFPKSKYFLGYQRLKAARHRFGERLAPAAKWPPFTRKSGDMARLEALRDTLSGQDVIVFGNGPSLRGFDPSLIGDRTTIGSNGVYDLFEDWGRTTDYLIIEDVEQAEKRGRAFRNVKGPIKLAALYNAHGIPRPWGEDLIFFNSRYAHSEDYFTGWGPHFSRDFAACVWLGNTVTYIGLQLAWHLGAQRVFLVGVDFSYGPLEQA